MYKLPNIKISQYVKSILVIDRRSVSNRFTLPLIANGMPTLLFNTANGKIMGTPSSLTLFGQTILPKEMILQKDFTLIAYFFHPHIIPSLFGISAFELADKQFDLRVIDSLNATQLLESLLNADSTYQMIHLIDSYILKCASQGKSQNRLIKILALQICTNPTTNILIDLQRQHKISERTLQRLFKTELGISPNQYRRICQFHSAFKQLQRDDSTLIDIAYQNGYSDQSHYIKSFKEYTNITPTDYRSLANPKK